jgi:iron complex transport system ATP-binding protein
VILLRFDDISFSYRSEPFVQNISFALRPGELVGVIGANGSGKSTILRLGAGLLKPRSGSVELVGRSLVTLPGRERAGLLGYLPQSVEASLPFRAGELVAMGAAAGDAGEEACREALNCVGLSEHKNTLLCRLSGGERRRAFIAMVLAQGGSVLLLDEPLAGLDLRFQYELLDLLRNMCCERQVTILLSLHDLILARELDRLLVVRDGSLLADGPPTDVFDSCLIRRTFDLNRPVGWLEPAR